MNHQPSRLAGGFSNPVFDSQHAFRTAMEAFSRPGRVQLIEKGLEAPPLAMPAAALVLALSDYTTTVYLSPALADLPEIAEYLRFYTDSVFTQDASNADFAVIDLSVDRLDLSRFAQGNAEYPDRSTTLIVIAPSLEAGAPLRLSGPGIDGETELRVVGLPTDFAAQWRGNRAQFPLGVDILFSDARSIVGLPRSARIIEGDA